MIEIREQITIKFKKFTSNEYVRLLFKYFLFSIVAFLPIIIFNQFVISMGGDYALQQIPFYYKAHDTWWNFFLTGNLELAEYQVVLGTNNVGANTFYYLTSPFMLFIILSPRFLIPVTMAFLLFFKFALGAFFFNILLRKYFNISPKIAFIGGLVYGLGGWGIFYIWFNHLADVLAFFPLTLIGAERAIRDKKYTLLMISMFIIGITNYFFLFAFAITNSLYIFFRILITNYKKKLITLLISAFHFVLGIGLCSIVLLAAYGLIRHSARFDGNTYLQDLLKYFFISVENMNGELIIGPLKSISDIFSSSNLFGYETVIESTEEVIHHLGLFEFLFRPDSLKRFIYPLSEFFFMNYGVWDTLLVNNSGLDNIICNMYISMPLVILIIPAFIDLVRKKKILQILVFIIVVASVFSPFVHEALAFFSQKYGRWQLFIQAIAIIFAISKLENIKSLKVVDLSISLVITLIVMISITKIAYDNKFYGLETHRFVIAIFSIVYVVVIAMLYFFLDKSKDFSKLFFALVGSELLIMINITMIDHGVTSYATLYKSSAHYREQTELVNTLKELDYSESLENNFFRVYNDLADRSHPNLQMEFNYKGLSAFHSAYQYQAHDFYDIAKLPYSKGNWSMGEHEKRYILEQLLGVKYYILDNDKQPNIPRDYQLLKCLNHYCLYQNPHYIELGAGYDSFTNYQGVINYLDTSQYYGYYDYYGLARDLTLLNRPLIDEDVLEDLNIDTSKISKGLEIQNVVGNVSLAYSKYENGSYTPFQSTNYLPNVFNYLDLLMLDYPEEIPADSIIYLNMMFGPNTRVALLSKEENFTEEEKKIYCNNPTIDTYCDVVVDSHMEHWYSKNGDYKYIKSFYTSYPIDRIAIRFLEQTSIFRFAPRILYTRYSNYLNIVNRIKDNRLLDVKYTTNQFKFKTNYLDSKVIVTNLPFDEGYKVSVSGELLKTFKANRGLLAFEAIVSSNVDDYIEYEINYEVPLTDAGFKITLISLFLYLIFQTLYRFKEIKENINTIIKRLKQFFSQVKRHLSK